MAEIIEVRGFHPKIDSSVFLTKDCVIIGDVEIASGSSIWFKVVIRGDVNSIRIGKNVNIQDACILHSTYKKSKTIIGDDVSVGHGAILHGCKIEDQSLIGMGATIMDNAVIPKNSLVAANSLVTENSSFPEGHLILGSPAKPIRPLSSEELEAIQKSVQNYQLYTTWYQ